MHARFDTHLVQIDGDLASTRQVIGHHLHHGGLATTQAQDQVQGGFLLDVVICQGPPIFELFSSEDEPLLIGRDPFFVLLVELRRGQPHLVTIAASVGWSSPSSNSTVAGHLVPRRLLVLPVRVFHRSFFFLSHHLLLSFVAREAPRRIARTCILALTLSMVSLFSTSNVMVFPVSVFTKICMSSALVLLLSSLPLPFVRSGRARARAKCDATMRRWSVTCHRSQVRLPFVRVRKGTPSFQSVGFERKKRKREREASWRTRPRENLLSKWNRQQQGQTKVRGRGSCGWNASMDARKAGARCIALERSGLHGCQFRCICVGGFLRVVKTRVAPLVQEGSSPFLPGHPCQRILLVLKLAHGIPCGWIRSYMLALAKWFGLGLTSFRLGVQRR